MSDQVTYNRDKGTFTVPVEEMLCSLDPESNAELLRVLCLDEDFLPWFLGLVIRGDADVHSLYWPGREFMVKCRAALIELLPIAHREQLMALVELLERADLRNRELEDVWRATQRYVWNLQERYRGLCESHRDLRESIDPSVEIPHVPVSFNELPECGTKLGKCLNDEDAQALLEFATDKAWRWHQWYHSEKPEAGETVLCYFVDHEGAERFETRRWADGHCGPKHDEMRAWCHVAAPADDVDFDRHKLTEEAEG